MLLQHAADDHCGRILIALVQEVLTHLQKVVEDLSADEFLNRSESASFVVLAESLNRSDQTWEAIMVRHTTLEVDLVAICRVRRGIATYCSLGARQQLRHFLRG